MDKKSKVLLFVFSVTLVASIVLTYYRMIVTRDFIVIQPDTTSASEN